MSLSTRRLSGFSLLAVVAAGAMLFLVALGGATRATDSGLACPTWPGCFSGWDFLPTWQFNVWMEHTHRLVAGIVAILLGLQVVWALARHRRHRALVAASITAFVAVIVQALLGAAVVWNLLRAELVTAHLGMAMLVVACQLFIAVRATQPRGRTVLADGTLARTAALVAAVTLLQILVGGHTTGVAAGLAYTGPEFPFLGLLSFAPVDSEQHVFNIAHRVLAVAVLAGTGLLVARARRAGATGWLLRLPRIAAWLVVVQAGLGIANLATGLSALSVIPHLAVASWIWAVLVLEVLLARRAVHAPEAAPTAERVAQMEPA